MSGWIKVGKDLSDTIRFRRVVRSVMNSNALRGVTDVRECLAVTVVLGALIRLWVYADTHISDDDVLDITLDEINDLVGVEGFAQALPADWLKVIDADHVQLPDFLSHNGSSEKHRRDNARRQADYRHRHPQRNVTRDVTESNARNDARPDQTKTRPDKNKNMSASPPSAKNVSRESKLDDPGWWLDFKLAYPNRAGDQGWRKAQKAANARTAEGHTPIEFIEGAKRYAVYCEATNAAGTQFVKTAAAFLGPDKPFLQPWTPPASKAQRAQDANVDVSQRWLEKQAAGGNA